MPARRITTCGVELADPALLGSVSEKEETVEYFPLTAAAISVAKGTKEARAAVGLSEVPAPDENGGEGARGAAGEMTWDGNAGETAAEEAGEMSETRELRKEEESGGESMPNPEPAETAEGNDAAPETEDAVAVLAPRAGAGGAGEETVCGRW